MRATPSASYSVTLRVEHPRQPGVLGDIFTTIGEAGGMVGAVDIVRVQDDKGTRDITVDARDNEHAQQLSDAIDALEDIQVIHFSDRTFRAHRGGKIEVKPKMSVQSRDALSMVYAPGVARVCQAIAEDREQVFDLTVKRNTIAVVTDGTAVLGSGDIGPEAAMPVMEGKAMLFKEFANVDAYPICPARALAEVIPEEDLSEDYIIPSVFDDRIVPTMAEAVQQAAYDSGAARFPEEEGSPEKSSQS